MLSDVLPEYTSLFMGHLWTHSFMVSVNCWHERASGSCFPLNFNLSENFVRSTKFGAGNPLFWGNSIVKLKF